MKNTMVRKIPLSPQMPLAAARDIVVKFNRCFGADELRVKCAGGKIVANLGQVDMEQLSIIVGDFVKRHKLPKSNFLAEIEKAAAEAGVQSAPVNGGGRKTNGRARKSKSNGESPRENLDVVIPPGEFQPGQLALGDATNASLFDEGLFNLIVTSPPYNVGLEYSSNNDELDYPAYLEFTRRWLAACHKWTKPHGRLCANVPLDKNAGGKQAVTSDFTRIAKDLGWQYHATIIWNEGNISRRTAWGSWLSASAPHVIAPVESIIVFSKGGWKRPDRGETTINKVEFQEWTCGVWTFNGESAKRIGHPAPFPRELPRRCIRLFSYRGDRVFDPFAGSGTTLVEAVSQGRSAWGVELDPDYRKLALRRIRSEGKGLL